MKKLLMLFCFVLGLAGMATAQTAVKKSARATQLSTKKKATAEVQTVDAPLKADGTPDKRFKASKRRQTADGQLKRDGTPDMRFKANKKN